ncbi:MAG: 16S rRNA (cytosine(1402)-N(4))-methyltransferase RsmH [bacterium]
MMFHVPVLVNKVIELFKPCLGTGTIVDATVGGGGHAVAIVRAILESERSGKGRQGRLLGFDIDPEAITAAASRLQEFSCRVLDWRAVQKPDSPADSGEMVLLVKANYADIEAIIKRLGLEPVSGVLFDLGISSFQLKPERGFAFDHEGPLDMRFDRSGQAPNAKEIIRRAGVTELERWLTDYGDEPAAKRISRQIYAWRTRIRTTRELADVVAGVVPRRRLRKTLARVFQAIRIVVNNELKNLCWGLEAAVRVLAPGGRLAVICYQSGEDRCFKELMRKEKDRLRVLTPKAIRPTALEVIANRRARSARLRVVEKQL